MPHHKFKLRPSVQYVPDKLQATTPAGAYKIRRLLLSTGRDQQYRFKNALEPSERIAKKVGLASAEQPADGVRPTKQDAHSIDQIGPVGMILA